MSVPNRGPELFAVNVAFISLAGISYLLRCFVRLKMVKAFGLDDWLMGLALVCVQEQSSLEMISNQVQVVLPLLHDIF